MIGSRKSRKWPSFFVKDILQTSDDDDEILGDDDIDSSLNFNNQTNSIFSEKSQIVPTLSDVSKLNLLIQHIANGSPPNKAPSSASILPFLNAQLQNAQLQNEQLQNAQLQNAQLQSAAGLQNSLLNGHILQNGIALNNQQLLDSPLFQNSLSFQVQPKRIRKARTAFTPHQLSELEVRFGKQHYLTPLDRDEIAEKLGLKASQVITWFQNRRAKMKRGQCEERFSSGVN